MRIAALAVVLAGCAELSPRGLYGSWRLESPPPEGFPRGFAFERHGDLGDDIAHVIYCNDDGTPSILLSDHFWVEGDMVFIEPADADLDSEFYDIHIVEKASRFFVVDHGRDGQLEYRRTRDDEICIGATR